jgi:hypothetical protein
MFVEKSLVFFEYQANDYSEMCFKPQTHDKPLVLLASINGNLNLLLSIIS